MNEEWLKFCDVYGLVFKEPPTHTAVLDPIKSSFLVMVESSQPNVNERLADCAACGFSVRWVWSEYDRGVLASMNWRVE
jgi:hypothetical protein